MTDPAQLAQQLGPLGVVILLLWDKLAGWARSLRSQGERIGSLEDRVTKLEERKAGGDGR